MPQILIAAALTLAPTLAAKLVVLAVSYAYGKSQQRKAERRARDAYNASLTDRLEMVDLQPDAPRTLPLGRVRNVEGVRRRWVSGENSEKLTMIVSFAGCQIDGFEQWFLDDKPVTLDGAGWVLTEPYNKGTRVSRLEVLSWPGGTPAVTLPYTPVAGTVTAAWAGTESYEAGEVPVTSVVGNVVNLGSAAVPSGAVVNIAYQSLTTKSTCRIRPYLGLSTQNLAADLSAEYPGKLRSTDRFAGIALAVVDVLYDTDIYPQGRPNVTALYRGARCYDPRKDSTAGGSGAHRFNDESTWEWSENPAVCTLRYATWRQGFALPLEDSLKLSDTLQAAPVCDTSTTFTLRKADGSTTTVTLPRYRCGIVISSAADPRSAMAEILETMAGRSGWAGGVWRYRAGTAASPAFTMVPGWLAQPMGPDGQATAGAPVAMSNGVGRDQKVNRVSGRCVDPDQRWQVLPFPAVQDATLIAAEGEYATEVEYQGVNHIAHAQHLGSIAIREGQAALRVEARCNLHAYLCELFDVGLLHLPRYGMTPELAKTAEVLGWRWHPTQGVVLQLAEITGAMYSPVAELVGRDPAPNSALPALGLVEELSITGITSGTEALTDGSVLTRTRVAWSAAVAEAIRQGGQIELQYTLATSTLPTGDWASWVEQGAATSATLPGLLTGQWYIFRLRAIKPSLGVRGPWSLHRVHKVASPPPAGAAAWSGLVGRPTDGELLNSRAGAVNLLWGAANGVIACPPGTYGVTIGYIKTNTENASGLQPGDALCMSVDVWGDSTAIAAGEVPTVWLVATDNGGTWHAATPALQNASTTRARRSGSMVLPSDPALMVYVYAVLFHQPGDGSYIGTVYAERAQVEHGSVATAYRPGAQPGATVGAPNGTQVAGTAAETVRDNAANALTAASTAATSASNAQADADAANAALADIASDNVLTAGEKPQVLIDWTAITGERAGILAQATAYGITTERTAYDNAVTTLDSYLSGLSPAVGSLSTNTNIVGATFRSNFATVYSTRQALLNKIADVARIGIDAAQLTADGKVVTFVQSATPTAEAVGDLWLDSSAGNKLYRWNGSAWVPLLLGTSAIATGAATIITTDADGDNSVGAAPSDPSTSVDEVVRSASYTNDTGAAIPVQFAVGLTDATMTKSGSTPSLAEASMQWSSASISGSAVLCSSWPDMSLPSALAIAPSAVGQVSLPAGETLTVGLRMRLVHDDAAVFDWAYAYVQVTAIKR